MLRRSRIFLLVLILPTVAPAKISPLIPSSRTAVPEARERQLGKTLGRDFQISDVAHISTRLRCQDVQPPQALMTPDPLLSSAHNAMKVRISFIIGTDGRVHSPLILESAGPTGDRRFLQTIRMWRYRPATCNGVPTETEGKIEFSSR